VFLGVVISHCLANLRKSHFRVAPTITMLACKGVVVQGRRRREKGGRGKPKGTRSAHLAKLCGRSSNAQTLAQTHTHWTGFQLAEGASGRFPLSLRPCPAPSIPPAPPFYPPFLDCVCGAQCAPIFFVSRLNSLFSKHRSDALLCGYISAFFSARGRESLSLLQRAFPLSAFTRLVLHNFNFINTFNAFLSAHIP